MLGKPWLTGNGLNPEILTSPVLANGVFPVLTRITQVLVSLEVLVVGRSCHPKLWPAREPTLSSKAASQAEGWSSLSGPTSSRGLQVSSERRKSSPRRKPFHTHHSLKNGILAPKKRILPHTTQESYKVQTWLLSFRTFQKPTNLTW